MRETSNDFTTSLPARGPVAALIVIIAKTWNLVKVIACGNKKFYGKTFWMSKLGERIVLAFAASISWKSTIFDIWNVVFVFLMTFMLIRQKYLTLFAYQFHIKDTPKEGLGTDSRYVDTLSVYTLKSPWSFLVRMGLSRPPMFNYTFQAN